MSTASSLAVWGLGGHAKVVMDAIRAAGRDEVVAVVAREARQRPVAGAPLYDSIEKLIADSAVDRFVVAIGDNHTRRRVTRELREAIPHVELVTVVHPAAVVAPDVELGPGTVVFAGAVLNPGIVAGAGVIFNTGSSTDHDGRVGDFVSIGPGARVGGDATLGDNSVIGLGAAVLHGRTIGADTVVGAGAVVTCDLPDRVVAYGVPAAVVRERQPGDPYL